MRKHRRRVALHDFEVPPREAIAGFGGNQDHPRLVHQPVRLLGGNRLFLAIQSLIDQHDKLRELVQPVEPRVMQHQFQILAGRRNALDIAFIGGAFAIEKRLVQLQQPVAERLEPFP